MLKWHDIIWTFQDSVDGSNVNIDPNAVNTFRFDPDPSPPDTIASYTLVPTELGAIPDDWRTCVLTPQMGFPLEVQLTPSEQLDPSADDFQAKHRQLVNAIRRRKLEDMPFVFERLVGTVCFGGHNHPVNFFQVPHCYKTASTMLLIGTINVINASPNGVISANG